MKGGKRGRKEEEGGRKKREGGRRGREEEEGGRKKREGGRRGREEEEFALPFEYDRKFCDRIQGQDSMRFGGRIRDYVTFLYLLSRRVFRTFLNNTPTYHQSTFCR